MVTLGDYHSDVPPKGVVTMMHARTNCSCYSDPHIDWLLWR